MDDILVIGGGLSGCEASWQIAERGGKVTLCEMRPAKMTPAHKTGLLSELLCSNSLKSDILTNASGLLKKEMRRLDSLILLAADKTSVPAGGALAVDRQLFSSFISSKIENHENITALREEVMEIPKDRITIIASGPLTSDSLHQKIEEILGRESLFFYDAISPIIDGESIDYEKAFFASRYDKGENDYLNCPLSRDEYFAFLQEIRKSEPVPLRDFEKKVFFEGCLPIEEMARRGEMTPAFGPLKPVGLADREGERPFAVVQLRKEDKEGRAYNMVGFQTRLTYPEQKRIFRMIPGLEEVQFLRYGSMHRNTYIDSPSCLNPFLQLKERPSLFFAGQLTGVEGYIESTAMGWMAGVNALRLQRKEELLTPPPATALGSLIGHITQPAGASRFQPSNIHFGLFPPVEEKKIPRKEKKRFIVERAMTDMQKWSIMVKKTEG
jgi:methylenetetrahydrofolate--tRNA-(uracil-5-)-methyltransferase